MDEGFDLGFILEETLNLVWGSMFYPGVDIVYYNLGNYAWL